MEQAAMLLKTLGLTDYETKALLTLLKLGVATAEQISEAGFIPLPRVYDTLVELQNKGFVMISKGRPKKFKVVPAEKSLYRFIELQRKNQDEKIKELKNNAKNLIDHLKTLQFDDILILKKEDELNIWSVEKRKNIVSFLDEQKTKAKKEVLIFSGDMSWLDETATVLRELKKRGVAVKVLVKSPDTQVIKENVNKAKTLGIDIKTGYTGLLRGHIIDDQMGAIVVKTPKGSSKDLSGLPDTDEKFRYELMLVQNPILIKTFKEYFNFWWKNLK